MTGKMVLHRWWSKPRAAGHYHARSQSAGERDHEPRIRFKLAGENALKGFVELLFEGLHRERWQRLPTLAAEILLLTPHSSLERE